MGRASRLPRQHATGRDQHGDGGRGEPGIKPLQKRRAADKQVTLSVIQCRQLLGIGQHLRMQRQPQRQGQQDTKRKAVQVLWHHRGHHAATGEALAKPFSQQPGLPIELGDVLDNTFRLAGGAGGKQLDNAGVINGRQRRERGGATTGRADDDQAAPDVQRPVAQHAVEQFLLLFQQRFAAVARQHRGFARMQRCQQGDDKQIAAVKTERPAIAFLLL